ncbi:unnamed protein product [Mytilus edulis]|uniref:Neurotransmitter-gated ion-channel ligand-binding domain-containing protein n=1 Tax=Mytilus edulis TaxID=6550 RepID=A0A8S3ST85_MYTED|nr:unnamed protein product [Mytilus edulis]
MSSQTLYGIQTIQNEIYCNVNEDYTVVSSEQNEVLHQRCSSKSSGTSSVDTFTIRARMENLEIALTMLNENFQRMENAMNKQIEKAIEIIIGTTGKDEKEETVLRTNDKYFMKSENKKLMKAVKFLTESSRIMRTALSEHTKFIDHITSVINQPTEIMAILEYAKGLFNSFLEFNEVEGKLSLTGYFSISWVDQTISWNSTENEIDIVTLEEHIIWKPSFIIGNSYDGVKFIHKDDTVMRVQSNGLVTWTPGDNYEVVCNADVSRYPFDTQICKLQMLPWGYTSEEIDVIPIYDSVVQFWFNPQQTWQFIESSVAKR